MTHLRTAALLLVFSLTPGCGTVDDEADPNSNPGGNTNPTTATTFAVAARDGRHLNEGEVVLNLHWFPKGSSGGNLSLRINGQTAVWGDESMAPPGYEATPGEALSLHPETGTPTILNIPIGLPPGTYDLEYVLGGKVVASLSAQTLDEANIYSFVAFGDAAAPSVEMFSDANPLVTPDAYPADRMTIKVVNLATSGAAIGAHGRNPLTGLSDWIFTGLAYGDVRDLSFDLQPHEMMFTDTTSADAPQGGFGFILEHNRFARFYIYDRAQGTTDHLMPIGDSYWQR